MPSRRSPTKLYRTSTAVANVRRRTLPLLINRAIPIPVLAADLDVRLVQSGELYPQLNNSTCWLSDTDRIAHQRRDGATYIHSGAP